MFKNHHLRFLSLTLFVLIGLGLSVVVAQDSLDQQPLLKMLANIPDTSVSRSEIYFNDRKAIEAAYSSAKMPVDWAAFAAYQVDKGKTDSFKPVDIWWRVWRNQQSSLMGRYMSVSDAMPDAVGFDFFAVEQEMSYGRPPLQTLMLNGAFDLNKVRGALTAHEFSQQDQSGVEVWCSSDGCDSGAKVNIKDRNPANPFGGDLGRKWPMIVQEGQLIGSPSIDVIQNHIAVQKGTVPSLGAAPEYRAAADALTQNGVLMQAYFLDGELLTPMSTLLPDVMSAAPAQRKAVIQAILKDYESLPVYKLLAFGDAASDSQQIGQVAMVYSNEADAKQASAILPRRIANYVSFAAKLPFKDILASRGVTEPTISVVESSGQFVVLVAFATPKPTIEQLLLMSSTENSTGVTTPGSVYHLLVTAAIRLDIGWLSTIPRDVLEVAAK